MWKGLSGAGFDRLMVTGEDGEPMPALVRVFAVFDYGPKHEDWPLPRMVAIMPEPEAREWLAAAQARLDAEPTYIVWGWCRHCGDATEKGDDPDPRLCVMCEKAGRTA
jgi:hypothetical protein